MNNIIQECILYSKELKILYVEDNPEARSFTLEMLKRFFKDITTAENGKDGLEKFTNEEFDIVLTDINMPVMNGLEMAKEIKAINSLIPILVLSAHNEENYFMKSIETGVDGYLLKPIEMNQFVTTLYKSVEKIHLQKEFKAYQLKLESINIDLEIKVKERTSELEHRLYHDILTNLGNHEAMMENLSNDSYETIFIIDINGFQKYNDIYGLEAGNTILKKFADKLRDFNANNIYSIYRIYGDGFVLQTNSNILTDEDLELKKSELLDYLETVSIYIEEIDEDVDIDVTIGASINEKNAFIKADMALNYAKKENLLIAVYTEEIDSSKKLLNDLYWKNEIKIAINNDAILPVFQAIVDKDQKIVKYESLMRLKKYEDGKEKLLSPFLFLDAAVNTLQYNKLTRIMVQKTFAFMQNKDVNFSINLSFEDLADPIRVKFLHEEIEKHGVHNRLVMEILESEIVSDYQLVIDVLKEFRKKGIKVAIDDFGSGYSNFEHILKLNPDFLKIDASLTKNILKDERTHTLIKAISEFSKELNIKVIAEFVSTKEIFDALCLLSIDEYQGYYFSVPSQELIVTKDEY